MTDAPPLRAKSPTDLLALVPSLLGFHPEESVVVLTVGEALTPFHARVDLPTDPVGVEQLADHLADVARRNRSSRVAVVVYSDDAGLAEALVARLQPRAVGRRGRAGLRGAGRRGAVVVRRRRGRRRHGGHAVRRPLPPAGWRRACWTGRWCSAAGRSSPTAWWATTPTRPS